jgi:Mlc titration factor MtfA (ptsG expression regulator)
VLQSNVPHYALLTLDEQDRLRRDTQVFLAEKNWEGCGGLEMTDEIRVTIAAHACIMLLGMEHDYFAGVLSILVYPKAFQAPQRRHIGGGLELDDASDRLGEAWYRGPVILAWKEIRREGRHPHSGRNLVWHEFAHQLDMLDRATDGTPPLNSREQLRRWQEVMTAEFNGLIADAEAGRPTLLDEYGATNEAEFFAVTTECFFDLPGPLRDEHPRLYALLAEYYGQDPARRVPEEAY